MPEGSPAPLRHGCRAMLAATVPLWGLGFLGAGRRWGWATTSLVHDAAVVTAVAVIVWWGIAVAVDKLNDKLVSLLCDRARTHAQEARTHLQTVAGGTGPRQR